MLARWAPFELLDRDFADIVRRTFGELPMQFQATAERAWAPPIEAYVKDGELHVRVEAPGIDPENDIDIEVTEGRLSIRGDRRRDETVEESGYWRREMTYGHFERTFVLPAGIDASKVQAGYEAGVLDIRVPLPSQQANKVKVEVAGGDRKGLTSG